jgi:hypothetical protein
MGGFVLRPTDGPRNEKSRCALFCGANPHMYMYIICTYLHTFCSVFSSVPDPDPLGYVNFELSRSASVVIVPDPDPYSFLATLFIKIIW